MTWVPSMADAPGTPLDVSVDLTSVEDGVPVQVATSVDLVRRRAASTRPPPRVQCRGPLRTRRPT